MATPLEFSEFTYGYALTENLGRLTPVKALPVFPSLVEEGEKTGGYDVAVSPGGGLPVLLQFKVPQVMTRTSKWTPDGFSPPYYRAHLRTRLNKDGYCQHSALLMHELNGHLVYYAAPRFHTASALETLFGAGDVVGDSVFIRPTAIGDLTDEDHYFAYSASSTTVWRKSVLVEVAGPSDSGSFLQRLRAEVTTQQTAHPVDFQRVLDSMVKAIEGARRAGAVYTLPGVVPVGQLPRQRVPPRQAADRLLERRSPSVAAATFARFWLDAELLLAKLTAKGVLIGG